MNNPYQKILDNIYNILEKLRDMIVWLAKRTLTVKDYQEFVDEFSEDEPDKKQVKLDDLLS